MNKGHASRVASTALPPVSRMSYAPTGSYVAHGPASGYVSNGFEEHMRMSSSPQRVVTTTQHVPSMSYQIPVQPYPSQIRQS